jgi:hypothetical protein
MTDKEIAEKKEEFLKEFVKPVYNNEWWIDNNSAQDVWQWIEEVIRHYYTQGKIEGYKECLEENEWEMEEDKGFLFKDNKLIPIKKGFKLKTGKDQEVTKFKLGKDN